jgi:hypothetical protein
MKLLTFLGTGNYQPTTYVWAREGGETCEHTSPYAPAATCRFLQPDTVVLFSTTKATEAHGAGLREALGAGIDLQIVPIPEGCSEDEMWQVFSAIAGCVGQGEAVAFDVTHGYRSLPMVAILAGAFLRTARQAQVEHILYGAWEARDQSVNPPRTPIFDLTPMFSLMEWAVAADRFARLGDARDMAQLLQAARPPYPARQADRALDALARQMQTMARTLDEVSDHLRFNRTHDALAAAHKLCAHLEKAQNGYPAAARPFAELLAQIQSAFVGLALEQPQGPGNLSANLACQRALIRWYVERQHYVQAATLAREWIVSWLIVQRGGQDIINLSVRLEAEHLLGAMHAAGKSRLNNVQLMPEDVPQGRTLGQLWGRLADVRNDLDHAGMRRGARAPDKLIDAIEWCLREIEKLPLPN